MGFKDDLVADAQTFFAGSYATTKGIAIPDVADISLGNVGRELELAMLFVDIRESTKIVDAFRRTTAARMYKSFLSGVSRIARYRGGQLRSFNGDGVLVAFVGASKETAAVAAAMNMSWFADNILKRRLASYFASNKQASDLDFDIGIGIHTGTVLVVRGGIRGENNNDLVWIGNATNYAVKLSSLSRAPHRIHITKDVYDPLADMLKWQDKDTKQINLWEWTDLADDKVLRSKYDWELPNQ